MTTEAPSHLSQLTDFVPREQPAREPLPYSLQSGRLMRQALLLVGLGCGLGALSLLGFGDRGEPARAAALIIALLGLASGLSARAPQAWLATLFGLWSAAFVVAIAASAVVMGWGLLTPSLLLPPLLVVAVGAAVGPRAAVGVAALAAACLGFLAWQGGWLVVAGVPPAGHLLTMHLGALGLAWAAGFLMHGSLQRQTAMARQSENRHRGLLALAADAYWEIDADYRLVAVFWHGDDSRQLTPEGGLGAVPWRLPRFVCDPETLDQLLAELDARSGFRHLPVGWQRLDGQEMRLLISGEPRFGERGEFLGYRGVARDVTAETADREALGQAQGRYRELFNRIPSPLVVHRHGRILEANPAAVALLGAAEQGSLRGAELLSFHEPGESRDRERQRLQELDNQPPGHAVPVTDFRMLGRERTVWVRAMGVRIVAEGGPATLSIYIDDTDRRIADDSLRRNEAMLSHLVATSPDLITLTDLASGRYVMVNKAFEKLSGYSAAQAIGRTSLELKVWRSEEERRVFVEAIQRQGSVSDMPVRFCRATGEEYALLVSAARFTINRREFIVINARDVTETERERLEREAILANASVGIAVTSNRHFVLANHHFEALYGWLPGEIIGQPGSVVWATDEDYAQIGAREGPALARGEAVEFEQTARRRDGSSFLARIRGRAVDPQRPAEGGTVWIIEDITARREAELALAKARDDAEAASRAKSAFLANTSHELRTPLNGIIGLARMAREPDVPEHQRAQFLEQIGESAQALADIISDILDLSKIEAGKLELEQAVFDLGDLLRSLQRTYGNLATARGLTLEFQPAADLAGPVWGDSLRVRQILSNYLGNALKFTPSGSITLTGRRLYDPAVDGPGARVRLEVRDTGVGVAAQAQARLFQPFSQADQSTTRRYGGTGLGLSICRELATRMGGEVGAQSTPGQGSCFWVELPLPEAQDSSVPALRADSAAEAPLLNGRRVLIVEDNPVNMLIAVAMMEGWGLQVVQANDGLQALDAVQHAFDADQPFDAVLMDVHMPHMSGHEATLALRKTQAGCHLPIIALTAAALVSERTAALEAGMNDFLTKPVDAGRLRASLARWVLPVVR